MAPFLRLDSNQVYSERGLLQGPSRGKELFDKPLEECKFVFLSLQSCLHSGLPPRHLPLQAQDKAEDDEGNGNEETESPLKGVKSGVHLRPEIIEALIHVRPEVIDAFRQGLLPLLEPCQSLHNFPVGNPWGDFCCKSWRFAAEEKQEQGQNGQLERHAADFICGQSPLSNPPALILQKTTLDDRAGFGVENARAGCRVVLSALTGCSYSEGKKKITIIPLSFLKSPFLPLW